MMLVRESGRGGNGIASLRDKGRLSYGGVAEEQHGGFGDVVEVGHIIGLGWQVKLPGSCPGVTRRGLSISRLGMTQQRLSGLGSILDFGIDRGIVHWLVGCEKNNVIRTSTEICQ
jgi:hypothetical protein